MGQVLPAGELGRIRQQLREKKEKVVFTNGCFDILHRGHVEYLTKAKALGDVLVVGVNTDDSVHRLKGPGRPIVSQDDRARIVSSLAAVDYVCLFEEDTPLKIITSLVPDVLVKGADWKVDEVVGRDVVEDAGGTVVTIEFVPMKSTTEIIRTILDRFEKR